VGQDPAAGAPTEEGQSGVEDDAALAERGVRLADAVAAALPAWVDRSLRQRAPDVTAEVVAAVAVEVEAEVLPPLRALLARDVDQQGESPLAVVRRAAATLSGALDAMGVPPPVRDDHQRRLFPDDDHDLVPATFADLSEDAGRAGIEWGASKAFVHRRRHRAQASEASEPAMLPDAPSGSIVGYVPDLMDRSKLVGVRFVRRPEDLVDAEEAMVVVDLSRPGVLEVLPRLAGRRVVGFGSHVDRATLEAAAAAGAQALPRSQMFRTWPDLPPPDA